MIQFISFYVNSSPFVPYLTNQCILSGFFFSLKYWSCLFLSVPTVNFIISQQYHWTLIPIFLLALFSLHSILYTTPWLVLFKPPFYYAIPESYWLPIVSCIISPLCYFKTFCIIWLPLSNYIFPNRNFQF